MYDAELEEALARLEARSGARPGWTLGAVVSAACSTSSGRHPACRPSSGQPNWVL
jgi:hypothetical protein